jgi:hypothetical protein
MTRALCANGVAMGRVTRPEAVDGQYRGPLRHGRVMLPIGVCMAGQARSRLCRAEADALRSISGAPPFEMARELVHFSALTASLISASSSSYSAVRTSAPVKGSQWSNRTSIWLSSRPWRGDVRAQPASTRA